MTEELCGDQGVQSILTLSLPECLMEFCKVTLTFESVDEIVWCDHCVVPKIIHTSPTEGISP